VYLDGGGAVAPTAPCTRAVTEETLEAPMPSPFRFLLACIDRMADRAGAAVVPTHDEGPLPWPYAASSPVVWLS